MVYLSTLPICIPPNVINVAFWVPVVTLGLMVSEYQISVWPILDGDVSLGGLAQGYQ